MSRVPTVRQADLDRAIRALTAAGLTVANVIVRPGGIVEITPAPQPAPGEVTQPLTQEAEPAPPADLDQWRARKHGRRAAQGD